MIDKVRTQLRVFLALAFILVALSACSTAKEEAPAELQDKSGDTLRLAIAGYPFARFAALFDGRITIEGCEVDYRTMAIGDMNTDVFNGEQTLDITEIGLHPFMLAYANDDFRDYTLLPVFPIRTFRHKSIFIRDDRGIESPQDLVGKTVGTPGYSSTSLTWIRGILQDEYGISPQDITWIMSAEDSSADQAGTISKQEQVMPNGVRVFPGPEGMDESELLVSGEVDALLHAAEPLAYIRGQAGITRLFPDYRAVEQEYYRRTGIFPIMHAVAIRTSLLEEHPWLAEAVFDAYSTSKQIAYQQMQQIGWASEMLPWFGQELEETRELMGDNYYSYGIDANRSTLETLFRYSFEQGFTEEILRVEDLFHPFGIALSEEKETGR